MPEVLSPLWIVLAASMVRKPEHALSEAKQPGLRAQWADVALKGSVWEAGSLGQLQRKPKGKGPREGVETAACSPSSPNPSCRAERSKDKRAKALLWSWGGWPGTKGSTFGGAARREGGGPAGEKGVRQVTSVT